MNIATATAYKQVHKSVLQLYVNVPIMLRSIHQAKELAQKSSNSRNKKNEWISIAGQFDSIYV